MRLSLDAFERRVLKLLLLAIALFLALSFVAFRLGVPLGGTDEAVESVASELSGRSSILGPSLPPWAEMLAFLALASLAGMFAGYLLPDILERRDGPA